MSASVMARDIMVQLAGVGITALVVGGCPRDVYHRNPVKDIDVIVSEVADRNALRMAMFDLMNAIYGSEWQFLQFEHYDDRDVLTNVDDMEQQLNLTRDFSTRVAEVWKFQPNDDVVFVVDILFVRAEMLKEGKLESFVDTFDFSINKCWMDIFGDIHGMPPSNTIEVLEGLPNTNRIKMRYIKLSQRYSQYDWSKVEKFVNGV